MTITPPLFVRTLFHRPWFSTAAAVVFWPLLTLWTWKLLESNPLPEQLNDALSTSDLLKLILAKCLHAGVYGVLAGLAWVWAPRGRWQLVAIGFLILHGIGTEIGQTYVPGRHGSPIDVLIDWTGIAIGVVVTRWIKRDSTPA